MKTIEIYTDGACSGNPGRGGFAAILRHGEKERIISRGYKLTTNNRMELLAVIEGLSALKEYCNVQIYSDSKYVIDSISKKWVYTWKGKGWKKSDGKKAENIDLWEKLLPLLEKHDVKFHWVRGHDGHEENERADVIAVEASQSDSLIVDEGCKKSATI